MYCIVCQVRCVTGDRCPSTASLPAILKNVTAICIYMCRAALQAPPLAVFEELAIERV
jgi:hypothetical protein